MKRTGVIVLAILTVGTVVWAWGGRSGDKNAQGQLTDLKVGGAMATVKGRTVNGSLWLAYTVKWKDGYELDYAPIKVKDNFSKTLAFKLRPQGVDEVIVCLWRYKVSAKQCAKENGKACQYCQKNGFHMEDRIDRKTGR